MGSSITLHHRIITSDGSERTSGEASVVTFERGTMTSTEQEVTGKPATYALQENYPNPFNPVTTLAYQLPEESQVTITIYDMLGREVTTLVNDRKSAGRYRVQWNATNAEGRSVSSGVYFYRIRTENYEAMKKMVYLK